MDHAAYVFKACGDSIVTLPVRARSASTMSYFDRLGSAYLERRKVAEKYNSKLKSTNSPSFLGQDFDRSRFSLLRGATPADQQNLHSVSSSTAGLAMRPHDSHPLDTSSQRSVTAANVGDGQSAIVDFVNNKIARYVRQQCPCGDVSVPLRELGTILGIPIASYLAFS